MAWKQLSMIVRSEDAAHVEPLLFEHGALCVAHAEVGDSPWYEAAPGEPCPWERVRLLVLFDVGVDAEALLAALRSALPSNVIDEAAFHELLDRDWVRAWMERFQPLRFGKRLWICPTTLAPPEPAAVNIRLDPGHAFGTGTHESTALCLEWLDSAELGGLGVLDFGCGSGVLAIAALRLGADEAWACDIDPLALDATRSNAELNGVRSRLWVGTPDALPCARADVLIANILPRTLYDLAPALAALQQRGDRIVLSGILEDRVAPLLERYGDHYALEPAARRGDWVLLSGTRLAPTT
ncbi:MAG: 50S ribosomal protein L11 methyltransferase [Candidatus Latescibacterota bacterium]|nr:MAG: 50S ribosomal protein L11 methyltransferase [Candidatus Latescibacterota bacterium]